MVIKIVGAKIVNICVIKIVCIKIVNVCSNILTYVNCGIDKILYYFILSFLKPLNKLFSSQSVNQFLYMP